MTKELIERITQAREHTQLYGQVLPALWVYQPFTMNAGELFSAIEALQARVVELGDELERERICHAACGVIALSNTPESAATMRQMKDEYRSASVQDVCNAVDREMALRVERDSLAAELAAARAQEPVSYRYKFTHPISGEPVWRDSSPMWNGQCVQEVQPLFAAPVPPVREPLSYRDILRIYNEVGPEDGAPYRFAGAIEALQARVAELEYLDTQRLSSLRQVEAERNAAQGVIETITKDPTWFELKAERDALAAELAAALPYGPRPTFGAIGSRDVDVAEAQRAWDKAMAAQPAQVPAGSIRLWDTQWASIVNHDNAYNGWSTNDAVNHAVRMTERYIAANVAQNNLPPLPAAPEVK